MNYSIRFKIVTILFIVYGGLVSNAVSATENCENEEEITIVDWQNWQKLTDKPIFSEGHFNSWVDIFVNELAEDNYRNTRVPYPVCAKIVKVNYEDESGKQFKGLTAMVKMASGYDSTNGDWWYAKYDDMTGSKAKKKGRLYTGCISCHRAASETDYLFSNEVMSEINKE